MLGNLLRGYTAFVWAPEVDLVVAVVVAGLKVNGDEDGQKEKQKTGRTSVHRLTWRVL